MAETRDDVRRNPLLARLRSDPRACCAALAVVAALFIAARTLFDTACLYHPLPHWDYWDFVGELPQYLSFDFGLADLWAQHNEHRILCGRLVFLADALWFGCNGSLNVVLSCLVQCAHAALLGHVIARSLPRGPVRVLLAAVVAGCLMFGSQSINLFWPFQVPFVLVYFAITASLLQLTRPDPGPVRLLVAALLACVACGSMANGLLVWPLLWSLCVQLRLPRRTLLFLVLFGAAVMFAYLYGYRVVSGSTFMDSVRDPARFAVHVCVLLGNPLWSLGLETAAVAGGITMLLVAWTLLRRVRSWFQATPTEALLLHLLLLVLGSVALAAMARLYLSRGAMLHGRYGLPILVLWAALFGLWFRGPRPRAGGAWRIAVATAFVLGLAVLAPLQRDPQTPMHDASADAAACLLTGVKDTECMTHIHGRDPAITLERAEILRSRRLSVFGTGLQDLVGKPLLDHFDVEGEAAVKAQVGAPQAVTGDPTAVRLDGFALHSYTGLPPELIVVADEQWRIVGLGMSSLGHDGSSGQTNWRAWAREADPGRKLSVYAIWDKVAVPMQKADVDRGADAALNDDFGRLGQPNLPVDLKATGSWSEGNTPASVPKPPAAMVTLGSWSRTGPRTGTVRATITARAEKAELLVPVVTGPDTLGMVLRIVDPITGRTEASLYAPQPFADRWRLWRVELPARPAGAQWILQAEDHGRSLSQWFAIGTPHWARAPG